MAVRQIYNTGGTEFRGVVEFNKFGCNVTIAVDDDSPGSDFAFSCFSVAPDNKGDCLLVVTRDEAIQMRDAITAELERTSN